ncbi:zinc finger protein 271-like [Tribolium madens]|uniref:zinc finger protein 271-like n=1 Tax=Tribolium madens TaxID=41895 RepID=UPI001CF72BF1|nr:zinc finger protein 271-like [Tribolium madens]
MDSGISVNNFSNVCRTCLVENVELKDIFSLSVDKMLKECTSIQLQSGDGLPEFICESCISRATEAYSFKLLCENSDQTLRNIVQNSLLKDDKEKMAVLDNYDECSNADEPSPETIRDDDKEYFTNSQDNLNDHSYFADVTVKNLNELEDIECKLCSQTLRKNEEKNHMESYHIGDNYHICNKCKKEFTDIKLLKRHMRTHKLKKNHNCPTCGKSFYGANDLTIHIRVHTGEKPLTCTVCSKAFADPRGLNSHMKTHTGKKPYTCNTCGKSFAHSFVLTTHKRTHTAERPYVCSSCGKTFIYSHNLAIHMRSHTGERPYQCQQCYKSFSSSSTLSAHMMTHTGEKRFVCSVCGKKVARSGDLAIHMRIHTGERPYSCTLCFKQYRMSSHLSAHMKSHTGEKNHVCSTCNKAFSNARILSSHMTIHTGEKPYTCTVCNKSFAHYSSLSTHRKIHMHDKNLKKKIVGPAKLTNKMATLSDGVIDCSPSKKPKLDENSEKCKDGIHETLADLSTFQLEKVLHNNTNRKTVCLKGKFASKNGDALVLLEKTAFAEENLKEDSDYFTKYSSLEKVFHNDIYGNYNYFPKINLNSIKATIIHPATEEHFVKYSQQNCCIIDETPEIYQKIVLPHITSQQFDLAWVYNILERKSESDRIVFEDSDPNTGFILLPDLKWNGEVDTLYLLAVVHKRDIKSLRDLTGAHLPLLKNIQKKGINMNSDVTVLPDFNAVCRTCLQSESNLTPLYHSKAAEMLIYCNFCKLKVFEDDGLPDQICQTCFEMLEKSFSFKQLCKKSESVLEKALTKNNSGQQPLFSNESQEKQTFTLKNHPEDCHTQESSLDSSDDLRRNEIFNQITDLLKNDENAADFSEGEAHIQEDFISFLDEPLPPPLPFQCDNCSHSFNQENDLKIHRSIHNSDLSCLACSKKFKGRQSLKRHLKIHLTQKPHVCKICSKSFSESYALVKHLRRHSGIPREKRHICEECGQGFSEPYYLKVHVRKHTGERPLACPDCDKTFADPRSLKTHLMIHSGERPFKCNYCSKSFIQNANLTKHLRVHTGEKPYACDLCDKRFTQSSSLEKHKKVHKRSTSFANKSGLMKHLPVHTNEENVSSCE